MTVTIYKSTDASAPVMCGQYGKFVQLLDAILVDGYGAKASLGWSIAYRNYTGAGTATGGANNKLIDTSQNFVVNGVTVGMSVKRTTDGLYGGITSISTTTNPNDTLNYTNTTNTPTFANLDAYTIDGNKRVYRAPSGNRYYLRVDDTYSTTFARVRGWEVKADALDAVDGSNTGPFPTDAQLSGGNYFFKSDAASAASRTWKCISNGTIIYLFTTGYADSATQYPGVLVFGDCVPHKAGSLYETIHWGHYGASYANINFIYWSPPNGSWKARTYLGTGGSVVNNSRGYWIYTSQSIMQYGNEAIPDVNGCFRIVPILNFESTYVTGHWPGLWTMSPLYTYLNDLDSFAFPAGPLVGRTFEIWRVPYGTNVGFFAVETSDTWS